MIHLPKVQPIQLVPLDKEFLDNLDEKFEKALHQSTDYHKLIEDIEAGKIRYIPHSGNPSYEELKKRVESGYYD